MKTLKTLLVITIAIFGFSATSFGQSTANATATATLIVPISVTKTTDMNFGTIAASGTAGTVALDYANGRQVTGGVSLPAGSTTQKTAVFTVTGEGTSTFSISIPSLAVPMSGPTAGMTVSNFVCEQGSAVALVGGTKDLKVKATLNVPANAAAGTYTNTNATDIFVTVNYN